MIERVAMLTPCPFHSGFGGVQLSARLAWEALQSRFGEAARLFGYGPGCGGGAEAPPGVSCDASRAALAARVWKARGEADLLLCWHLGLLKLAPLAAPKSARLLQYLHGIEAWRPSSLLSRTLLARVDAFLSNSEFTWRGFTEHHRRAASARHTTVALGLGERASSVPPGGSRAALMIGRLDPAEDYKGHRETIDAWPLVLAQAPDAELWIAGDGALRTDLEAAARAGGVSAAVRFLGRVSDEAKEELLRRCACLALPSRGEGFGLVYLEAMRLGKPCLVSTLDAGREVVEPPEAGLAADPRDRAALAAALVQLLGTPDEPSAWSARARARYEANYTAAHFQRRLLAAIEPS